MAFHYFATADDMAEIFADIEGEAPIRIVYAHERTGTDKACYRSVSEIPGFAETSKSARHRPSFLVFPLQCEPVMTEVEVPTRTLMCIYRTDNPDSVDVRQPSLIYVESFDRPEFRAGEISFFALNNISGEPGPTAMARALAKRVRKAIRRRSALLYSEGTKRVYIARRALAMARNGEVDLFWHHHCWSAAETVADAELLNGLRLPEAASRDPVSPGDISGNLLAIREFRTKRVEFREPTDPDILFVAAHDDLCPVFEAAQDFDDMNYSRLGPPRFRSVCSTVADLPGLGVSSLKREITSGIIAWRGDPADYHRVCEPYALADFRIGLLPEGFTAPSMVVFPGGALLRGRERQPKRLLCGYARIVHGSGEDHFSAFGEALRTRQIGTLRLPGLPIEIAVLPQAGLLLDAGLEIDSSPLALHIMQQRLNAKPDNVVLFPDRPGTGAG